MKYIVFITFIVLIVHCNVWLERMDAIDKQLARIMVQVTLNTEAIVNINANLNNLDINYDVIVKEKKD